MKVTAERVSPANQVTDVGRPHQRSVRADHLRTEFISHAERLQELEAEWRQLWSAVPDTTPFQSPDWILPWWRHYGEGPLFSFAFWNGAQLAGIALLYVFTSPEDAKRRLFLIGTGNSDYLDVVFLPESRETCWKALVTEIARRGESWDECSFQRLRPGSPLLQSLEHDDRLVAELVEQEPCLAVDLTNPNESMLRTAETYARKLKNRESFSIEQATTESMEELLSAFEQLHERRWREKGLPGVLAENRDRSFHHEVASRFLQAGALMLYGLRAGGSIVSVVYGFHDRDRTYSYLSGFDPEYRRMSVGTIILGHAIRRSMEHKRYYDFLKGQEPYKYRWGAREEKVFTRTIRKA